MDPLTIDILKNLSTQGIMGSFVVLFAYVIVRLRQENKEMQERIFALQETRLQEAQKAAERMMTLSDKTDQNVDRLCDLTDKLILSSQGKK